MRVYLAGPMRGIPHFNYPAFHAAAKALRAEGHVVFSPAEYDVQTYGKDISNATGDAEQSAREHGFDIRSAFCADLTWLCTKADAIALLPGWGRSKGATAEHATAVAIGLQVLEI